MNSKNGVRRGYAPCAPHFLINFPSPACGGGEKGAGMLGFTNDCDYFADLYQMNILPDCIRFDSFFLSDEYQLIIPRLALSIKRKIN
jgi:hypothetical protein